MQIKQTKRRVNPHLIMNMCTKYIHTFIHIPRSVILNEGGEKKRHLTTRTQFLFYVSNNDNCSQITVGYFAYHGGKKTLI